MEKSRRIASCSFSSPFSLSLCLAALLALSTALAHDEDPFICPDDLPDSSLESVYDCSIEDECAEDYDGIAFNEKIAFCACEDDVECILIQAKVCNADCPLNTCCTDCWIGGSWEAIKVFWNPDEQRWIHHSRHVFAIGQLDNLKESQWVTIFVQFEDTSGNTSPWSEVSCDYHVPDILCCWEDFNGDGKPESTPCWEGDEACF